MMAFPRNAPAGKPMILKITSIWLMFFCRYLPKQGGKMKAKNAIMKENTMDNILQTEIILFITFIYTSVKSKLNLK
jgi:hypothetical protein